MAKNLQDTQRDVDDLHKVLGNIQTSLRAQLNATQALANHLDSIEKYMGLNERRHKTTLDALNHVREMMVLLERRNSSSVDESPESLSSVKLSEARMNLDKCLQNLSTVFGEE